MVCIQRFLQGMVCLLLLLPLTLAAQEQIYRSVDDKGQPIFSDQADEHSQPVTLPPVNTVPPTSLSQGVDQPTAESPADYVVSIRSPSNDQSFVNAGGSFSVVADIQPASESGVMVQLLVDGAVYGEPQTGGVFEVSDLSRGSHTLEVDVIDEQGSLLGASDTITVHVHQATSPLRKAIQRGGAAPGPR